MSFEKKIPSDDTLKNGLKDIANAIYDKASVNTGTFDPTSDNPAGQKSIADYYGQGGEGIVNFENITDKNGNKRFIEGTLSPLSWATLPSNWTLTYGHWSLSGTHLMIVIAGKFTANSKAEPDIALAYYLHNLPSWIISKLSPIATLSDGTYVFSKADSYQCNATGDGTSTGSTAMYARGSNSGDFWLQTYGLNNVFANDTSFRIQFDFVIDNA